MFQQVVYGWENLDFLMFLLLISASNFRCLIDLDRSYSLMAVFEQVVFMIFHVFSTGPLLCLAGLKLPGYPRLFEDV